MLQKSQRNITIERNRYHLKPVRMAMIKKSTQTSAGEDVEKRQPSCTASRNVNDTATTKDSLEIP